MDNTISHKRRIEMKTILKPLFFVLLLTAMTACGGATKRVNLPSGVSSELAVLPLGADTSYLNGDQVALLQENLDWMDRDLINTLNRMGFRTRRISSEDQFSSSDGHMLRYSITTHKMVPKGARIWGGMMAGNDRLDVLYELVDSGGGIVLSWEDSQNSTRGARYVAKELNNNAAERIRSYFGN